MTMEYAEVIGDPIAHSKSPDIHNFWLAELGLAERFEYRRALVKAEELETYFAARRTDEHWRGSNVTIPHKESVARLIDRAGPGEGDFGAVNTITPEAGVIVGRNTDVAGVIDPLDRRIKDSGPGLHVAIIGGGGASRAALWGLKIHPLQPRLSILVRRVEQGQALIDALDIEADVRPITDDSLDGIDVLINASPLGMTGKPPLILSLGALKLEAVVFDMVYAPNPTELLYQAQALGMTTIDGYEMLVGQAAAAFRHFFGVEVPAELIAQVHRKLAS